MSAAGSFRRVDNANARWGVRQCFNNDECQPLSRLWLRPAGSVILLSSGCYERMRHDTATLEVLIIWNVDLRPLRHSWLLSAAIWVGLFERSEVVIVKHTCN